MRVHPEVLAPHEEEDQDISLPYPVYRYPRWPVKRLFTRAYLFWLLRICGQKSFDLIHCHGVDPAAYVSSFFKALKGLPYIVTPRMKTDRPYILGLGRMVDFKGFDCLIRAFFHLTDRWQDLDLVIVGDGPKYEQLKELAYKSGLSELYYYDLICHKRDFWRKVKKWPH